tara:strand:- start:1994 stop:2134 length:141 start_codon:yes stop_codon:yes gene_type:complete
MTDFFNCIADIVQESFKIIPVIGDPLNWAFIAIGSFIFVFCAKKFI